MRRRDVLWLATGGMVAGCGARRNDAAPKPSASPASPASGPPRLAVAEDYEWFSGLTGLSKGFCFTWVLGVRTPEVLKRLGGKELERVRWQQLVGAGDGPRGYEDRYFVGIAKVDNWSLIVEDNGTFGVADALLADLSAGTTTVSHYRAMDGHGRVLLINDRRVQLDFDPQRPLTDVGQRIGEMEPALRSAGLGGAGTPAYLTAAAFALVERLTRVAMTPELLDERTYALSTVPKGRKSQ